MANMLYETFYMYLTSKLMSDFKIYGIRDWPFGYRGEGVGLVFYLKNILVLGISWYARKQNKMAQEGY